MDFFFVETSRNTEHFSKSPCWILWQQGAVLILATLRRMGIVSDGIGRSAGGGTGGNGSCKCLTTSAIRSTARAVFDVR